MLLELIALHAELEHNEHSKTFDRPVVRLEQQLRQRRDLRSPVPPVRTVDDDAVAQQYLVSNVRGAFE